MNAIVPELVFDSLCDIKRGPFVFTNPVVHVGGRDMLMR
jgi:hypothetical protein